MDNQIEKMAKDLANCIGYDEWAAREYGEYNVDFDYTAYRLYEQNYRKIDEDSVVLSKEEYDALRLIENYHIKSCGKNCIVLTTEELEEARKQAIKDYMIKLENRLDDVDIILHEDTDEEYLSINGLLDLMDKVAEELRVEL